MDDAWRERFYRGQREIVLPALRQRMGFAYFTWWWSWVRAASWLSKRGAPEWLFLAVMWVARLGPDPWA